MVFITGSGSKASREPSSNFDIIKTVVIMVSLVGEVLDELISLPS